MNDTTIHYLLVALIAVPFFWVTVFGIIQLLLRKVPEEIAIRGSYVVTLLTFAIDVALAIGLGQYRHNHVALVQLGDWFKVAQSSFPISFVALPETVTIQAFACVMVLTITKFSSTYLHRERGVNRFFFLLGLFQLGNALVLFSNSIDILFMGWELVGITSVLLISFYGQREAPVKNALWALCSYRICDLGLLLAAGLMHLMLKSGDIQVLNLVAGVNAYHAISKQGSLIIALLVVYASLAKSGQFPFFSWVMRAMEGPTPSSALYYGALSIALGPIMLIKFHPLIMHYPEARVFLFAAGAITAPFALMASQARSDVKSILAHSAILQMAFVFMELALGLKWIAILHIMANGFTRLYQFLRSMDALKDFYENPLFFRGSIIESASPILTWMPKEWSTKLYYMSLHGTGPDVLLVRWVVTPWMNMLKRIDRLENDIVRADPVLKTEKAEGQGPLPEWRV